ncbi:hypothetical protein JHK87_015782 [Glycine soja]|nr:hypothetical protein JHK87_015782 [Glycine soja]
MASKCFFPQNLIAGIRTPLFILNTAYDSWQGAARTQAPTTTNYDVGSATWADLRKAPLQSAMEVTSLGHRPS